MLATRTAVRYFSSKGVDKQVRKVKKESHFSRIKKKLHDLLFPEKCQEIPPVPLDRDTCAIDPKWQQPRVVIIGAGIAGLSAAQYLLQCGINNFLILEATERPGGRIHSRWTCDCMGELGAMWIDGASVANLTYILAARERLLKPPLTRTRLADNTTYFTLQGQMIKKPTSDSALNMFKEIIQSKASKLSSVKTSVSLGEFIQNELAKELGPGPSKSKDDVTGVLGSLYNELTSRLGQDPCMVHPEAIARKQNIPGGRVAIPLGFGSILAPLLRNLPRCSITYCKPVKHILWEPSATKTRAVVICADKEEIPADYVIITTPLGVLKNEMSDMFCPQLPKKKRKAIQNLGYGPVERVFIQYEKPLLIGDAGFGIGWPIYELKENPNDWRKGIGELTLVPGSTKTIQGTVGGSAALALADTPQEKLIPQVGELMRNFSGDQFLPDPIDVQRSSWSRDIFFQGSYTYMGLDSKPHHFKDMAEPIPNPKILGDPPLLLFAGEATSHLNYATVHGARESGIREANRIIKLTNVFQGPPVCRPSQPCPKKKKRRLFF